MIKAIIFDVGNVLVKGINASSYIAKVVNATDRQVWSIMKPLIDDYTVGKISRSRFWPHLLKELGKPHGKGEVRKYEERLLKIYRIKTEKKTGTINIAKKLKRKGYKLAVLSNTVPDSAMLRKRQSFMKIFDYKFFSADIKLKKTDRRVYLYVARKLRVKPSQCLYIDNNRKFINAAEKIRMQTITFRNPKQLENSLQRMKVL